VLPWRENEKLIKALYEKVQSLEANLNLLRTEHEKLALITEFKNEIASRVASDLKLTMTKEMSGEIAEAIQRKLSGLRQGVI